MTMQQTKLLELANRNAMEVLKEERMKRALSLFWRLLLGKCRPPVTATIGRLKSR